MTVGKWTDDEIKYAIENRLKKSYSDIGKDLGRTRNAVMVKINRLGLKLPKKYNFNHDFFEKIDSEEKAYWLGFLYADGYISNDTELGIHLSIKDIDHLKKFNKSLSGNMQPIKFDKTLKINNKTYQMCALRIYSKKIVADLIKNGVIKNKSLKIKFPEENIVPRYLLHHFIRGFFDGDGSISLHKEKNQIRCKFTCASREFLDYLSFIFKSMGIHNYIGDKTKYNKSYNLGITGKFSNKKFLEYIYNNNTICLTRKYNFYYNNKELLIYKLNGWNNKLPQ